MPTHLPTLASSVIENLSIPGWLVEKMDDPTLSWLYRSWSEHDRMQLAVDLSRWNVEHGTGGPFGAAVFCQDSGSLVSVGVNCVVSAFDATAHAEVVAMRMGSQRLRRFNLSGTSLYSSAQPCCMCLGAILWSGICSVYFAVGKAQVETIGFDEGPGPSQSALRKRGISMKHMPGINGIFEQEARAVLNQYCNQGGLIYNGGSDAETT